jgi:hypothetical protein
MANTYLGVSTTSSGTRTKWTTSFWIKRNNLSVDNAIFGSYLDAGNYDQIKFTSDGSFEWQSYQASSFSNGGKLKTNRKFRDASAWYHIVCRWDTNNSTADDRMKIWVNGEEETSFAERTNPTSGRESLINLTSYTTIGRLASNYLDGCLSHVHFCDNQLYQASDFGETDSTTGEWKIKTDVSVSYGTIGYFILKDGNSLTDQSGLGNNLTLQGGTLTNTEDCPSNVFPTINPLTYSTTKWNLEYGNLRTNGLASGESAGWRSVYGTLGASSGKYYFEMKVTGTNSGDQNNFIFGIVDAEQMGYAGDNGKFSSNESRGYGYRAQTGKVENNGVETVYGNIWTVGDIVGCAFDLDNHKIYWSKNGVWQNSGDPTSGSTGTGSAYDLATGYTYLPAVAHYYDEDRIELNFGNGYFGTTAVSSAGTNASGNGIFEYDVPTGYTALSTKGLNL